MNTLSYKTMSLKKEEVQRKWYVIDAEGMIVGRLSTQIAHILRGKHKPSFTPHVDCGDCVIVLNADKVRFTGDKWNAKKYITYSGYPGGQKIRKANEQHTKKPLSILEIAVKGMLPKTKLADKMIKKLFLYKGTEHNHHAQQPEPLKF